VRINLRKIVTEIRDSYARAQKSYVKSATTMWPFQTARDWFPDISTSEACAIARGDATIRWNQDKREIEVHHKVTMVPVASERPE
jgi:hypothetical protein